LAAGCPAAATRTFTFDAENRQVLATINGVTSTTYAYDGDGRRVQKSLTASGVTTTTTYVYDADGSLAAEYGGPAAPFGSTLYLTGDHLGSTRAVTDSSGNVKARYDYAPFGEELTAGMDGRGAPHSTNFYPTGTQDAVTQKFTGQERDSETGLDFFQARYFSGPQGRFTSPDEPFADHQKVN
jgi:RHS repeat-associated protein